jgi:hypothetical protein
VSLFAFDSRRESSYNKSNETDTASLIEFWLVGRAAEGETPVMTVQATGEQVYLQKRLSIDLTDMERAEVRWDEVRHTYHVDIVFTRTGSWEFSEITGENVGQRMGVVVDGVLVMAPLIRGPVNSRKTTIYFNVTKDEAETLAARINKTLASLPEGQQQEEDTEESGFDKPYPYEQLDLRGAYIFEPVHVSEAIALEETLGSGEVERDAKTTMAGGFENLFPNAGKLHFAQPLLYKRPRTGDLIPWATYLFSLPDSIVRFMNYGWALDTDIKNLKERDLAKERHLQPEGGLYAYLNETLVSMFGIPEQDDVSHEPEKDSMQFKMSHWKAGNMNLSLMFDQEFINAGINIYWDLSTEILQAQERR